MRKRSCEDTSLTMAKEGNDYELATSFAIVGGRMSEDPLEGPVLEAYARHGNQYLLFLTDDIHSKTRSVSTCWTKTSTESTP